MIFHFVVAVWGDAYVDTFLKVGLPSQLASHLEVYTQNHQAVYKIYTKASDEQRIRSASIFLQLSTMIATEIHIIPTDLHNWGGGFQAMTYCHKLAIKAAWEVDAHLIFLSPDVIFTQPTFINLLKIAETGKRGVVVPGVRVSKEQFMPSLLERFTREDGILAAPPRELVKLGLDNLHPISKSYFLDSETYNLRPSHLYWEIPGSGMLIRAYHQHPLLIHPRKLKLEFGTIDFDYYLYALPDPSDFYVVEDSDEMAVFEMSNSGYQDFDIKPNRFSIFKLARFTQQHAFAYHRHFVQHKIRYHYTDLSEEWAEIERESDKIIRSILFWFKIKFISVGPLYLYYRFRMLVRDLIQACFGDRALQVAKHYFGRKTLEPKSD